jgi:hypothetical protein
MVSFWTALWVFFFPWTREAGEEEFSPLLFYSPSFLESFKKTSTPLPTCWISDPWFTTWWRSIKDVPLERLWGGCTVTAPTTLPLRHNWAGVVGLSPLFFSYKYKGRESTKKGQLEKTKKKKKRKNRGEKRRRSREQNRGGLPPAPPYHRPQPQQHHHRQE